ncbi:transcriptional regulator, Cro/CI family [mine drainage metagenome]|uniref:Transcriptional regulator, Cro/CI family n=1 Tax=mine drainage metagenome TaxID=410659 RepID=T0Y648_9ZZZZ
MHCGFCGKGELQSVAGTERLEYRGQPLKVGGYTYSVCKACSEEVVTPEQMKINQRLVADAKRGVDGFLTSTEIRQLRDRLGLSQADAGKVFGGGPNAFYKYENGEVMQSQALDRLMVLARDDDRTYQRLRGMAGLQNIPVAPTTQTRVVLIAIRSDALNCAIDPDKPVAANVISAQASSNAFNQAPPSAENALSTPT